MAAEQKEWHEGMESRSGSVAEASASEGWRGVGPRARGSWGPLGGTGTCVLSPMQAGKVWYCPWGGRKGLVQEGVGLPLGFTEFLWLHMEAGLAGQQGQPVWWGEVWARPEWGARGESEVCRGSSLWGLWARLWGRGGGDLCQLGFMLPVFLPEAGPPYPPQEVHLGCWVLCRPVLPNSPPPVPHR